MCILSPKQAWGKHPEGGCFLSCWLLATLGKGGSARRAWEQWAEAGLVGGGPCRMHSLPSCHPNVGGLPSVPPGPAMHLIILARLCVYLLLLLPPHQEVLQGRACIAFVLTSELNVLA